MIFLFGVKSFYFILSVTVTFASLHWPVTIKLINSPCYKYIKNWLNHIRVCITNFFLMQVKAFLKGDSPPFSAGQLEGMASMVNMNVRLVKRLSSTNLRYWMILYMRQQPKEQKFSALVLRFIKDRVAAILLTEVIILSLIFYSMLYCIYYCCFQTSCHLESFVSPPLNIGSWNSESNMEDGRHIQFFLTCLWC